MKKIAVCMSEVGSEDAFQARGEHTGQEPLIYLKRRLERIGYDINTVSYNSVDESDWVFFWNAPSAVRHQSSIKGMLKTIVQSFVSRGADDVYAACIRAGLRDRLVLVTWEPAAVLPENFDRTVHEMFKVVFTWNDRYVHRVGFQKFCWPQSGTHPQVIDIPFCNRKLLVNFSANKFSCHSAELYTARRQTIRYFEQHYPASFDLYGRRWDRLDVGDKAYTSWRGAVDYKWKIYPNYKFGLCYENMCDEPGWVTEKIFDCMRAGCVPIYWGAPNIEDYVDKDAFIDRTQFQSDGELAEFLHSMSEEKWFAYRSAIVRYLNGDKFKAFLPDAFANNFIRIIQ